ncbi:MAG: hypothetical protein JWM88_2341 [Verrucomicrobia bacterium]|nr:hypothetical protein [Verrucomicrobiota bacterium]
MNPPLAYLLVFVGSLAVDLVPFFGPPAWILMAFLLVKFHLNPWLVLAFGVPASTLGRYVLSLYIPYISRRLIKARKHAELEFVGKRLRQKLWLNWLFVFVYSLLPLSTTALFTAAGMARIGWVQIIPPFFAGKFISDAVMLFTSRMAAGHASEILQGAFSLKAALSLGVGLVIICLMLFLDWRILLEKKKVAFNFRVWK